MIAAGRISRGLFPMEVNAAAAGILEKDFFSPGISLRTDDPNVRSEFSQPSSVSFLQRHNPRYRRLGLSMYWRGTHT